MFSRRALIRTTASVAAGSAFVTAGIAVQAGPSSTGRRDTSRLQDDVQTGIDLVLPLLPYGQTVTIDPHRTVNWGPFWTLLPHVWSGLLRFNENGAVEADLAQTVESNGDLTVWTAKLRSGLRFASGREIVAGDFVASWKRALDPSALSPMSAFMAPILGFTEYTTGKSSDLGIEAPDDETLVITLDAPLSSFPAYLATFTWAVVDGEVLADTSVADPFLAPSGAGGWTFTEFVADEHITMIPNPNYWEEASPSIASIRWDILGGDDAESVALQRYTSGDLASADVPLSAFAAVSSDQTLAGELQTVASQGSTLAIGMDFNQTPFNDVRIRRAVAASIDRNVWAKEIWADSFVAASAFTAPITAANAGYTPPSGIAFNVDDAKKQLADAKFKPEEDATDIVYYQSATDSTEDQQRHAALLKMIQDNLGLVIRHDTSLTLDQIASQQQDNGGRQFDIVWWWPDIDSPAFLGRIGGSSSPFMDGWFNWSKDVPATGDFETGKDSIAFDTAIADAIKEPNPDARNTQYARAEQLLLDDAVYIPLGYWVQRYLQKSWLKGTRQGPWTGRIPTRFNKDVVVQGKP